MENLSKETLLLVIYFYSGIIGILFAIVIMFGKALLRKVETGNIALIKVDKNLAIFTNQQVNNTSNIQDNKGRLARQDTRINDISGRTGRLEDHLISKG